MPKLDNEAEELFRAVDNDLGGVNWHAIVAANSTVSRVQMSFSDGKFHAVFVPWYTRDGAPVCHDQRRVGPSWGPKKVHSRFPQKGDLPVTVGQAAAAGFRHPWMSEQRIEAHRPTGKVRLLLPAYDVKRGYLLLDGNHRAIATIRAGVDYDVELVVIHGPIDPRVHRDLVVFA